MPVKKQSCSNLNTPCVAGFTLLEVMIALLIFSIGLLGLAGLQGSSLQNNKTSDLRSIAIIEAHDLAERIRANERGVSGDYDTINTGVPAVPGTDCINSSSCTTPALIAAWDIYEWQTSLSNLLPSGRGKVFRPSKTSAFTILVMWDEARTGALGESCSGNPAKDLKCYQLDILP